MLPKVNGSCPGPKYYAANIWMYDNEALFNRLTKEYRNQLNDLLRKYGVL